MGSSMMRHSKTVLMADDDLDDCFLTQDAWEESGNPHNNRFVRDGAELLDYLYHRGKFFDTDDYPLPGMTLLDLNMARKMGIKRSRKFGTMTSFAIFPWS